jgi:uncharacterized protein YcbK (DUF882 family)
VAVRTGRKAGYGLSRSRAARRFGLNLGLKFSLGAIALVLGCQGLRLANAVGDTRTISLHHVHTNEDITVTFKRNGRYDDGALQKLNWFLRDWRRDEQINMDPHLFDLLWEVQREVGAMRPIQVICGYRAPETNSMLRARSNGVALFSQHISGNAMDFFIPGVPIEDLRVAALRLQGGGVGYYPSSGSRFVHLDTGNVRYWPRMSREELVRIFPDERTVHIPADGQPLAGYTLALADIERGAGHRPGAPPKGNVFAKLIGVHDDEDSGSRTSPPPPTPLARPASLTAPEAKTAARVPSRPATYEIAKASTPPAPTKPRKTGVDPISTASIFAPWPTKLQNDRVSPDLALAYAASARYEPAPPTALQNVQRASAAIPPEPKRPAPSASNTASTSLRAIAIPRADNPWLHAVVLAPSMHYFMTSTPFNPLDPRQLGSLMQKPRTAMTMTFSADPYDGMTASAFSGKAVQFMATVNFGTQTAALR